MNDEIGFFEGILKQLKDNTAVFLVRIVVALFLYMVFRQLIKWIRGVIKKSLVKASVDAAKIRAIDGIVRVVLYILLFVCLAGYLGIQATSLLAVLGSLGLTAGLAFQGALSNFAGGILIITAKPFKIDDYIYVPAKNLEGTVKDISIIYTKIITNDQKTIVLPNGELANQNIVNASAMAKRRMELTIGISYNADIDKAKKVLKDAIKKDKAIIKDTEIEVYVQELAESTVKLLVRCWVPSADFLLTKFRLTETIKKSFDANGIGFPYPQLDVHVEKVKKQD